MGKVFGGLFSLLFFIAGVMLAPMFQVHATERLAFSNYNDTNEQFSSVSRVNFDDIVVFEDKTVINTPLRYARVASNSMAPFITDKSVVFEKNPSSPESILIGDIISFTIPNQEGVIMHMVTEIIPDGSNTYFKTKGVANEEEDPWLVPYENIVGVVVGTFR